MTLILGVRCRGGIVMGADTAATYMTGAGGRTIRNEGAKKIQIIEDKCIFALTGSTAMAQRLSACVQDIWTRKVEIVNQQGQKAPIMDVQGASSPASAFDWIRKVLLEKVYSVEGRAATVAQQAGWRTAAHEAESSFMLALPFRKADEYALLTFNAVGLPDEATDALFCNNIGSGQAIADPFMGFVRRVLWDNKPPTVRQGVLGVLWALQHAISLDPGGVGGDIHIATLEFNQGKGWVAKEKTLADLQEHYENIKSMEAKMRACYEGKAETAAATAPSPAAQPGAAPSAPAAPPPT